jgi:2,5-diamino-6-(ribosylamino)-4(3H)-pyrimidinone 5'-phosphate reductase
LIAAMSRRPFVLINVAATVDGKIDTHERRGAAISSEADRARVDRLRASVDGVMVGGRTLHAEDPRLTVRSDTLRADRVARGEPEQPARIGIASRLALRPDARFLSGTAARIILFVPHGCAGGVPQRDGVELYETGHGRVDLVEALGTLARIGLRRVMVEGGGTLNFELLRLGLVDEVQLYLAPLVFGGVSAPTLADGDGLGREQAIHLGSPRVEPLADGGVLLRYMVRSS